MIRYLFSSNQWISTGYDTFLKSLLFKLFVLIFHIWMRIIPVSPQGNVLYVPSHSKEKVRNV